MAESGQECGESTGGLTERIELIFSTKNKANLSHSFEEADEPGICANTSHTLKPVMQIAS